MNCKFCFGNWKLNKDLEEAKSFVQDFKVLSKDFDVKNFAVFPSHTHCALFSEQSELSWGPQNISEHESGAYTGEVSARVLAKMRAKYALIGHSERRHIFGEKNETLNLKVKKALEHGLIPVYCIGETETENEELKTYEVLKEQISIGLKGVDFSQVILAYEPVWAIGTGKAATPEIAGKVHDFIRDYIKGKTPILYGGSVKPENAQALFQNENVDGFLIGGASLNPETFVSIYKNMESL